MKITYLPHAADDDGVRAAVREPRSHKPADEGMRGADGQPQVDRQGIPDDGTGEGGEDHVFVDDIGVNDALADGGGDADTEEESRHEVEEGCPDHRL